MLARSGGRMRCGHCDHVYNALSSLFDEWPESGQEPPRFDETAPEPVAGSIITPPPRDTVGDRNEPEQGDRNTAWIWTTALALLLVVTVVNSAWTFRTQLMDIGWIRGLLQASGLVEAHEVEPYRDPSMIHLVSRDLHQHPTLAGMLALSATFVSRAEQPQPYPAIELTLSDAGSKPVARRVFQPSEYLPGGGIPGEDLSPGIHVPILLEFADPGPHVSGFSLDFR